MDVVFSVGTIHDFRYLFGRQTNNRQACFLGPHHPHRLPYVRVIIETGGECKDRESSYCFCCSCVYDSPTIV